MKNETMTGEMVEDIMRQLPEYVDPPQLSAFILTLVDRYAQNRVSEAVSLMLTTTIVYARTVGVQDPKIAALLRAAAEQILTETHSKQVH